MPQGARGFLRSGGVWVVPGVRLGQTVAMNRSSLVFIAVAWLFAAGTVAVLHAAVAFGFGMALGALNLDMAIYYIVNTVLYGGLALFSATILAVLQVVILRPRLPGLGYAGWVTFGFLGAGLLFGADIAIDAVAPMLPLRGHGEVIDAVLSGTFAAMGLGFVGLLVGLGQGWSLSGAADRWWLWPVAVALVSGLRAYSSELAMLLYTYDLSWAVPVLGVVWGLLGAFITLLAVMLLKPKIAVVGQVR